MKFLKHILVTFALSLLAPAAFAATVVTSIADSGSGSLRNAIAVAASGDTITFAANLSGQNILLNAGQLSLNNSVTIDASALPGGVQINGRGITRVFNVGSGATVVLTALTITNGNDLSGTGGGGIDNAGNLTMNQCTLAGNLANNISSSASGGGAVFNSGSLTLNQCTLASNHSDNDSVSGGGGAVYNTGTLNVNQCTLTANSADNSGGGGGIYNTGTLNVYNSIIAGNTSLGASGGDIFSSTFNASLNGANIVEDINGQYSGLAPINADPQLAPLGNYGGPTLTMRPLPGSPAINACFNTANFTTDQRGVPRGPGISDIGAVKLAPPAASTLPATGVVNSNATLNATVNPATLATTAWFQWGLTNNPYSSQTTPAPVGNGSTTLAFSNNLTGLLTPGVVYHCRVVATNSDGSASGGDVLFGSAPVVTLFGAAVLTNECHTLFTDPGATNAAHLPVTVTGSLNTNSPGIYQLTYTATNSLGGSGTITRTVTVVDTTGPVITVLGANPLYVGLNGALLDPGATALDACGGEFAVTASNNVNLAILGGYTITYSSTDSYGNTAAATRAVIVKPRVIVTTANDSGAGSLREAISNSVAGDYIQFATNLSGSTILLTSGELDLTNNLTIDASALPNGIQINGHTNSCIFHVNNATVTLTALTITNGANVHGKSIFGGGIFNSGILTLNECTVAGNSVILSTSSGGGGGIFNDGTLTLNHSIVASNNLNDLGALADAAGGGGIYNSGSLAVNQCIVVGNYAFGTGLSTLNACGGGIYNAGTLIVTNQCVLTNNFTDGNGGGIFSSGSLTVTQCLLTANGANKGGGGIYNGSGSLTVNQSTLFGNGAGNGAGNGFGGGIYNGSGSLTVNLCTLFGNGADGGGAGIYNDSGNLTLNQSTLVGNSATSTSFSGGGGGIDNKNGVTTLFNSIVAGNSVVNGSGADIYNLRSGGVTGVFLIGANIIQNVFNTNAVNSDSIVFGPAAITNVPLLAALGNYGGPTPTMPPLPGSPAVDVGSATTFTNDFGMVFTAATTDQRGFPRPLGLAPDIGAVEGIYNAAGPGQLTGMTRLINGSTRFMFTNLTDASYTVLASTNVAMPINTWSNLGPAVESPIGSGHFQFTDPQATNYPQRFYLVRSR